VVADNEDADYQMTLAIIL